MGWPMSMWVKGRGAVLLAVVAVAIAACGRGKGTETAGGEIEGGAWTPAGVSEVNGVPAAAIRAAIGTRLDGQRPAPLDEDQWRHVGRLYKAYGRIPLWLGAGGLDKERTAALTDALLAAPDDGLNTDAYPVRAIARALAALAQNEHPTADQYAEADVLLTSAYVALGEDLLTGQIDPKSLSQDWHIDPQEEHVDSALARSFRSNALARALARMRPQDPAYAQLQHELPRWRQLVARGGWPSVPAGNAVKPGELDSPARLAAVRRRLVAEGIAVPPPSVPPRPAGGATPTPPAAAVYDRGLAGAVAEYQARHGIVVDSILGAETVQSLNLPAAYRLEQITANLERFRWLPRTLGSRYILVNVPAFRLQAFGGGKPTLDMKVIVGQEYEDKKTPVFSDSMEYVVFRPYWLVTPAIQAKELQPKIDSDPAYMAENDYEYFTDHGEQRIRQRPGPRNSLGLIKFMFPNDFNIYLHDTPQDELFEKDIRAYSHGCIRVEKPEQLAQFALGWPLDQVEEQMRSGPNDHRVRLPRPIPVYIVYFTTYVADGQLRFGNDLYSRDDALTQAVAKGAMPSAGTLQAIEALERIARR